MTVAELIAKLQMLPPDLVVVFPDDEWGPQEASDAVVETIYRNTLGSYSTRRITGYVEYPVVWLES